MSFLAITITCVIVALVYSIFSYRTARDRIEQTCVEESKYKTFMDEFVSNLFVSIPVGVLIFILDTMTSLF